jgi:hypothetical protein
MDDDHRLTCNAMPQQDCGTARHGTAQYTAALHASLRIAEGMRCEWHYNDRCNSGTMRW